MNPGDPVRLIPDEDDEPDRYDGLMGMILWEDGELGLGCGVQKVRFFRLLVNGKAGWRMPDPPNK